MHEDETADFWQSLALDEIAARAAVLSREKRQLHEGWLPHEVMVARRTVSDIFVRGHGIEVGAGSRPFPIPFHAMCSYGDVRDGPELRRYFKSEHVASGDRIDAQTFLGIPEASADFTISAHVIEHLENPIGSIVSGLSRLKTGGVYILAVPDARHTFDRYRPLTSLEHLLADAKDGGAATRLDSYRDFLRDTVVREWGQDVEDIEREASRLSNEGLDIHFHVWTGETFLGMLNAVKETNRFEVAGTTFVVNENIFVLRRLA